MKLRNYIALAITIFGAQSHSLIGMSAQASNRAQVILNHLKKVNPSFEVTAPIANVTDRELLHGNPLLLAKKYKKTKDVRYIKALTDNPGAPEYIRFFLETFTDTHAPSFVHFANNMYNFWHLLAPSSWYYRWGFLYDQYLKPELSHVLQKFAEKESELNAKGYYTFAHGQCRSYYFHEKLYTVLWGLQKKKDVSNFLFAHIFGEGQDSYQYAENDPPVLFMNYAFFANIGNTGSSSAHYVVWNWRSGFKGDAKVPFRKLGYGFLYEKHKAEIERLAADYENLCNYGTMLLIAVPKEKINEYLQEQGTYGMIPELIKDAEKTVATQIMLDTLINHPEKIKDSNELQFCLLMTPDKGLNPESGIQIHPIVSGDPEKLKELQKREDALFAKIKADIEAHEEWQNQTIDRAVIAMHLTKSAGMAKL